MAASQNPYTVTFGKEPQSLIPRTMQQSMILDEFRRDNPSNQVYVIVGPRGSGKTVFMTSVSKRLAREDGWITVELNPERSLLESLVAKLNSERNLVGLFRDAGVPRIHNYLRGIPEGPVEVKKYAFSHNCSFIGCIIN